MRPIFKQIILLLVLSGLVFVFYVFGANREEFKNPAENSVEITEPLPPLVSLEFRLYKNLLLRFSLVYPKDLQVKEYDDGTSASTITFEEAIGDKGFQIFVVPYAEDEITKEQFLKDLPSGFIEEPIDILIDGVSATMFESKDAILGNTREIWFINHGFLYEVTTRKELGLWLVNIMQTWRFSPN